MNDFRNEILDGLDKAYDQEQIEHTEIPAEGDAPRTIIVPHDSLSPDGNDGIANLFFTYLPGEDNVEEIPEDMEITQLFNIVIQLSEEIPQENLNELRIAVSRIGLYVLAGNFMVSETGNMLCYKNSFLIYEDDGIQSNLERIDTNYGLSISVCSTFMDFLLDVAAGIKTADEMMVFLEENAGR